MDIFSDSFMLVALVVLILLFLGYLLFRPAADKRRGDKSDPGPEPDVGAASLEDLDRSTSQGIYELSPRKPVVLGRSRGQDRNKQYVTIAAPTVGRQHAMIQCSGNEYWLIDKASRNGSFVNEQQVSGKVRLKHGDVIKIYKYSFRFMQPQQGAEESTMLAEDLEATQLASPADPSAAPTSMPAPAPAPAPTSAPAPAPMSAPAPTPAGTPAAAAPTADVDFMLDDVSDPEAEEDITLENFIEDASLVPGKARRPEKG